MMRIVWVIARNDLQITLQSRQNWLILLLVPLLTIYLAGLGARALALNVTPIVRVDILDADRTPASELLAADLAAAAQAFVVCRSADADPPAACLLGQARLSPELAAARLADEVTAATITIPAGFAASLQPPQDAAFTPEGRTILEYRPGAALVGPEIVLWALQNAVTRLTGPLVAAQMSSEMLHSLGLATDDEFYAAQLASARRSWGPPLPVQVVAETTRPNAKMIYGAQVLANGFQVSTPAVAVMFVMISVLGLTQSLAEERLAGILRRVGMLPVRKAHWLAGKLLATSLLGMMQFVVLLAFGALLGVGFGGAPGAVLLVAVAYVLAVTAMALALAAVARLPPQASALATFAWLLLVPLGGGWWPLLFVPGWLRTLGHLSPVAWCLDAFNAMMVYGATGREVLVPTGVLLLFASVFFSLGVLGFDFQQTGGEPRLAPPYFGGSGEGDA